MAGIKNYEKEVSGYVDKNKMDLVIDKFSETELIELRNEGFPV